MKKTTSRTIASLSTAAALSLGAVALTAAPASAADLAPARACLTKPWSRQSPRSGRRLRGRRGRVCRSAWRVHAIA